MFSPSFFSSLPPTLVGFGYFLFLFYFLVFGTCSYDQFVDVRTLQFQEEIPEVFQLTPQERISERIVARIVDFPLL